MSRYEEKTDEQLWQAIDALKRSPGAPIASGVMPARTRDTEENDLMPLVESLSAIFQEESSASSGQTNARLRLQSAIEAEFAGNPVNSPAARRRWPRFAWSRSMAMMALLLLLAVTAIATGLYARSVYLADQFPDSAAAPTSPLRCLPKSLSAPPQPNKMLAPSLKGSGPALKSIAPPPKCD